MLELLPQIVCLCVFVLLLICARVSSACSMTTLIILFSAIIILVLALTFTGKSRRRNDRGGLVRLCLSRQNSS